MPNAVRILRSTPGCRLLFEVFLVSAADPHALKLYIDGNCYQNPGGAGAYALGGHPNPAIEGHFKTGHRAEA